MVTAFAILAMFVNVKWILNFFLHQMILRFFANGFLHQMILELFYIEFSVFFTSKFSDFYIKWFWIVFTLNNSSFFTSNFWNFFTSNYSLFFTSNDSGTFPWSKTQHQPSWSSLSWQAWKEKRLSSSHYWGMILLGMLVGVKPPVGPNSQLKPFSFVWRFPLSYQAWSICDVINLKRKKMISTPLMMENPVSSPMVPPIRLSWASILIFLSFSMSSKVAVSK